MPYYRKGRYVPRRRRRYRRNYGRKVNLYKLNKEVKSLKQKVNTEFKYHDVEQGETSFTTTGVFVDLNYVDQGDTVTTRDGDQLRMKSIEYRYTIDMASAVSNELHARVIIFVDTEPDGSGPTLATLLDSTVRPWLSPRNLENRNRYY